MEHVIAHELDEATARKVVERAFSEYKSRFADYKPELTWASAQRAEVTFNAKGVKLSGAMSLRPGAITLDLDVPFLLRPFKKRAIEIIDREVHVWLTKARQGQI